jgi:hypothetical protein
MSLKRFRWVMELPDLYNDVAGETVMEVTTVFRDGVAQV